MILHLVKYFCQSGYQNIIKEFVGGSYSSFYEHHQWSALNWFFNKFTNFFPTSITSDKNTRAEAG